MPRRNFLSIVAVMKGEFRFVKEWVVYHSLMGVDHFYLYNNDDDETSQKILEPYVDIGLVTLTDWKNRSSPVQTQAYADFLENYRRDTQWTAVVDLDEFIVPDKPGQTIQSVIKAQFHPQKRLGAVCVHWRMFGSSFHQKRPVGSIAASYLLTNHETDLVNQHVKTIARTRRIDKIGIHDVTLYARGGGVYNTHLEPVPLSYSLNNVSHPEYWHGLTINHYHTKSEEDFTLKIKRGRATINATRSQEYFDLHKHTYNEHVNVQIVENIHAHVSTLAHRPDTMYIREALALLLYDGETGIMSTERAQHLGEAYLKKQPQREGGSEHSVDDEGSDESSGIEREHILSSKRTELSTPNNQLHQ